MHLAPVAVALEHAVGDVRRGHDQVEVELALEPLADDLHVEQPEEAAAKAEAERLRRLGLVEERGIVELQPLERVTQLGVLVGVAREQAREDHRLDVLVARQRLLGGCALACRQRVADAERRDVLEPGDHVAHLAGDELRHGHARRGHEPELLGVELGAERHRSKRGARLEAAVDDPDERDHAAVLVVGRVEDERARRRLGIALGGGDPLDDRVEHLVDVDARLGGDADDVGRVAAEQLGHLERRAVGVGRGKVDLVDDRDDLELVLDREVGVRERLRLDPLRGVDDEHRPLARLQRARHLVGEVDVPRRVDQVQLMALPGDAHRLRLDRDPALALEIHRIEQLLPHVAVGDGVRELENPIGQGRFPVVDVRDDGEVADPALVHGDQARMLAVMRFCLDLGASGEMMVFGMSRRPCPGVGAWARGCCSRRWRLAGRGSENRV